MSVVVAAPLTPSMLLAITNLPSLFLFLFVDRQTPMQTICARARDLIRDRILLLLPCLSRGEVDKREDHRAVTEVDVAVDEETIADMLGFIGETDIAGSENISA